jgi:LacI family transcriptional regulator
MARTPARRPTLRDVAERAEVSFKTVSRVVNGEPGVSGVVVGRVQTAIESLGYVPDERARRLRQSTSPATSIGFVLVDVSNPFFSAVLRGLEDVARARQCLVLSASSDQDPVRQDQLVETFLQRRVAGMVVVPCDDHLGPLTSEIIQDVPVVYLDCEPKEHLNDLVRTDHYAGARTMTDHLLAQGHRDIGFLGDDPSVFSAGLRFAGYRDAMHDAGAEVRDEWVLTGRHDQFAWHRLVREWLSNAPRRPTAVVTAQNFVTIGAVRAVHELGLARTLAMVAFDEIDLADVVQPGITVLPQEPRELGRRAGELLFGRIDGSVEPPTRELRLSTLVERGSGELPVSVTSG